MSIKLAARSRERSEKIITKWNREKKCGGCCINKTEVSAFPFKTTLPPSTTTTTTTVEKRQQELSYVIFSCASFTLSSTMPPPGRVLRHHSLTLPPLCVSSSHGFASFFCASVRVLLAARAREGESFAALHDERKSLNIYPP